MIIALIFAVIIVVGFFIIVSGGKPKPVPPLREIFPSATQVPDSRPYYAPAFKKGLLENLSGDKKDAKEKRAVKKTVAGRITAYVIEGLSAGDKPKHLITIGRSQEEHANIKILTAALGAIILLAFYAIFSLGGVVSFNPIIAILAVLIGTPIGFILPDNVLKSRALKLRLEFDSAFYSWLDVVSQYLSTGEEASNAMVKAASLSQTWPFKLLYSSLSLAQLRTMPVYVGLENLAHERGLENLNNLKEALKLSSDHGIEISNTLRSFIQSYRDQSIIDAETKVKSFAEQAALPLGMVVLAFLILIAYPGISGLLGSSGFGAISGDFGSSSTDIPDIDEP